MRLRQWEAAPCDDSTGAFLMAFGKRFFTHQGAVDWARQRNEVTQPVNGVTGPWAPYRVRRRVR